MSDESERPRRPASGADSEADRADRRESGDVADDEGFDEPYREDEPDGDELGPDDFEDSDSEEQADKPEDEEKQHTDQDRWRRVAWVAVISLIVGVGWALILSTILLSRSGDRTAELISLFESGQEAREAGQEAREAALARLPESQAERRATIEGLQEQSQLFKAQELSAFAEQSESNANTRQAVANEALANAQRRQESVETLVLGALTAQAKAIASLQSSIDQMRTDLTQAINKLREAIKNLGPRP